MTDDTVPDIAADRYDCEEEIGSGGFGTVYLGRDERLDRAVAIKRIQKIFDVFAQIDRDEVIEQFRELTRAQARLAHPSVVQIYDVATDEEYPFVVTEHAPHGNIRQLTADDDRELSYAVEYFVQVLHGVHAAHDEGLVHGNIHPENVVLGEKGNAKLSDFGLTTLVELDADVTEQVYVGVGAVEYRAPEQIKRGDSGSVRSDIYSLGILFYEMLTGDVPSRRSPMPSEKHSEIPREIDDLFDRMTLDDPDERYQTAEEVLADIYGSRKIVDLIDRRSGVVYLEDPLEHGRTPDVEGDGHLSPSTDRGTRPEPASGEPAPASASSGRARTTSGETAASASPSSGEAAAAPTGESAASAASTTSEASSTGTAEAAEAAEPDLENSGSEDLPPLDADGEQHDDSAWSLF